MFGLPADEWEFARTCDGYNEKVKWIPCTSPPEGSGWVLFSFCQVFEKRYADNWERVGYCLWARKRDQVPKDE